MISTNLQRRIKLCLMNMGVYLSLQGYIYYFQGYNFFKICISEILCAHIDHILQILTNLPYIIYSQNPKFPYHATFSYKMIIFNMFANTLIFFILLTIEDLTKPTKYKNI